MKIKTLLLLFAFCCYHGKYFFVDRHMLIEIKKILFQSLGFGPMETEILVQTNFVLSSNKSNKNAKYFVYMNK